MMMKLMKFLVVALVAGGVCAPVPSQAGEVDGKAVLCEWAWDYKEPEKTLEMKRFGLNFYAYVFKESHVYAYKIRRIHPDYVQGKGPEFSSSFLIKRGLEANTPRPYVADPRNISWYNMDGWARRLNRKTLEVWAKAFTGSCELIDPDKVKPYFSALLNRGKALQKKADEKAKALQDKVDEKRRSENKL